MKHHLRINHLAIILFGILTIGVNSCGREQKRDLSGTLTGDWYYKGWVVGSESSIDSFPGNKDTDDIHSVDHYRSDGTYSFYRDGLVDTGTFSLSPDKKILCEKSTHGYSDSLEILLLNNNNLITYLHQSRGGISWLYKRKK